MYNGKYLKVKISKIVQKRYKTMNNLANLDQGFKCFFYFYPQYQHLKLPVRPTERLLQTTLWEFMQLLLFRANC